MQETMTLDGLKAKLAKLDELLPTLPRELLVGDFGRYLAERAKADLLQPDGFVLGCELVLRDLAKGRNGFTGQEICNRLAGERELTDIIRWKLPEIAAALFGPTFAAQVRASL